jgi:hypothetical protein
MAEVQNVFLGPFMNLGVWIGYDRDSEMCLSLLWTRELICTLYIYIGYGREQFTNFGAHLYCAQAMTDPLMNLGVWISSDSGFVV